MTEDLIVILAEKIQDGLGCSWEEALKLVPGARRYHESGYLEDYLVAYKNARAVGENPQRTTVQDAMLVRVKKKKRPALHYGVEVNK